MSRAYVRLACRSDRTFLGLLLMLWKARTTGIVTGHIVVIMVRQESVPGYVWTAPDWQGLF